MIEVMLETLIFGEEKIKNDSDQADKFWASFGELLYFLVSINRMK